MDDLKFEARLSAENRKDLLYILSYIEKFNSQAVLRFNDDGIIIQVADPAHVSMLNVCIYSGFFTSLVARGEIGINVGTFYKILRMMEEDNFFAYVGPKLRIFDSNQLFEMNCYEIDAEQFEFPADEIRKMSPIEFFESNTMEMVDTIKKWTSQFKADKVRFKVFGDRLTLSTTTTETSIQRGFTILTADCDWESQINTKYFTQLPKTDNAIVLSFRNDFPIMIQEQTRWFTIQTFVAPMAEMDDD